jgi:oligopeptide/dipeptide ABC transporter ATP-binding protein
MNAIRPFASDATGQEARRADLLAVEDLTVDMAVGENRVRIVDGISFRIGVGQRVALVGESGSGKSVTAAALMRLNRRAILGGRVVLDGTDVLALPEARMTKLRGAAMGMVFQDPMSSLDPLMTIGDQVAETLRIRGVSRAEAMARALAVLEELGVTRAAERLRAYPHEFSGGMRQRVVLAMALIAEPRLLIADEPTTALDVRVQQQVLEVLDAAADRRGLAVMLITHDLGIVAGFAERVMVMYSGRIVEDGPVDAIFADAHHPYTRGLIGALPRVDRTLERLVSIPGAPPPPAARPSGCAFHPRCPIATAICKGEAPRIRRFGETNVACHHADRAGAVA